MAIRRFWWRKAASRDFNRTLPQSVVDRAIERDEASARAEYLGEFRTDIEGFVSPEVVRDRVPRGVYERPYQSGISYLGFVDPSGGSQDSFALAIGHVDFARSTVILDCLREAKPPFSPESVTEDFCKTLASYKVNSVVGDKYAGEWPREQFSKYGVLYEPSAAPKSDLYRDLLPLLNSARIELLDHPKLVNQLCGLERRTARGGRDSIDHVPGGHDDVANVCAGLASLANRYGGFDASFSWNEGVGDDDDVAAQARQQRAQRIAAILGGSLVTVTSG